VPAVKATCRLTDIERTPKEENEFMCPTQRKIAFLGLAAGSICAWPVFADDGARLFPTPDPAALTYTTPASTGIPYRWWVTLGPHDQVDFGYYVGALSWWQPSNPPATPGWTHNSNWVALTLTSAAVVTIKISPDVPVPCAPPSQPAACDATGRTGSDLYPAVSLYRGQDTTSPVDHVFNPIGNFWAVNINYLDSSAKADRVTHTLTFRKYLPAGKYTINIGGAGAISPYCYQSSPCYSGGQSYQAEITTAPNHAYSAHY
jgi:hypothetical protein